MNMAEKRRQKGSGSIHQREADERWIGTYEAGQSGRGTRRRITVSATSKAECDRKLKAKIREILKDGIPVEGVGVNTTVKTWGEKWLKIRRGDLRPTTFSGYTSTVNRHIIPAIGRRKLTDLTPADMRAVTTGVLAAGNNSTTARLAHRTLMKMLRDAILEGHQVPQRVMVFRGPPAASNDRAAIPLEDALKILEAASNEPDGSQWIAALLQGMRPGERLGLTWDCVDFQDGLIDISWQLQRITHDHNCAELSGKPSCGRKNGGHCTSGGKPRIPVGYEYRHLERTAYLVRPKSEKGFRGIPMVPWMMSALEQWRDVAPLNRHGLVWAGHEGAPVIPADDGEAWRRIQERAGVSKGVDEDGEATFYVPHEGRHTTATLLMEAGVDPKIMMEIMGHSAIATSRGYMHVSKTQAREALAQVALKLNPKAQLVIEAAP